MGTLEIYYNKDMLPMLLLSNLHLVVYLFGAVVFASMAWLYFDAMVVRPSRSVIMRGSGAMMLAIAYLLGAVMVEGAEIELVKWLPEVVIYGRIVGYLILGIGVWGESLSKRPRAGLVIGSLTNWVLPVLPAFVGLGYLRRASVGLERHLKGMAYGMYILSLAEILDLRRLFVGSKDIRIYEWVRDFGWIWSLQIGILVIGLVFISRWVFGYLLRRFETQITLFMGMLVLSVFAVATSVFTYVMARELESSAKRESQAAVAMINNNWSRVGDGLLKMAEEYKSIPLDDKEQLSQQLAKVEEAKISILDNDRRDVISGEKLEGTIEGIGYKVEGEGSARKVIIQALLKREGGFVLVQRERAGAELSQSAKESEMAIRLNVGETVIASSEVPGYPEIAAPLGLKRQQNGRLGGVAYISSVRSLQNAEQVEVATLEAAKPMASLWQMIALALMYTYLTGVVILIVMEVPAVVVANYLTRQLR